MVPFLALEDASILEGLGDLFYSILLELVLECLINLELEFLLYCR